MKSSNSRRVLFTGLNVQELLNLVQILVFLEFLLRFSLAELLDESGKELGDGVSLQGNLDRAHTSSAVSEAEEVLVVDVVGDERVLTLDPLQLLFESSVDLLEETRLDKVVRAGGAVNDGLGQWKDGTSLSLLSPGGWTERTVQSGVLFQRVANERANATVGVEPGGHSDLLPQGGVGLVAFEE